MASSTPTAVPSGVGDALNAQSGTGQKSVGMSISTFLASLATAIIVFTAEFLLFIALKGKLTRIYQPRTYLVPERERTAPSPAGLFRWVGPVFRTSNSEFIQKCGLDAYFFLRYLRMLLKIFIPLSVVILPVLIPVNKVGGKDRAPVHPDDDDDFFRYNVSGLDQLAWGNIRPEDTHRYWAHLVLAVIVVVYVCGIFFDELRGYIRLRQAYLTSPQHRLRASATTVLVTSIPNKWLSVEALDGLFDIFPGGVRNIWLNRDLDQLNAKIKVRNQLALTLESAETELVKACKKAQLKKTKSENKKNGKRSKETDQQERAETDKRTTQLVESGGVSSGDPHQVAHTVQDVLRQDNEATSKKQSQNVALLPKIGQGVGAVGKGVGAVGNGVTKIGQSMFGGLKKVGTGANDRFNTTGGVAPDQITNRPVEHDAGENSDVSRPNTARNPESTTDDAGIGGEHRNSPPPVDRPESITDHNDMDGQHRNGSPSLDGPESIMDDADANGQHGSGPSPVDGPSGGVPGRPGLSRGLTGLRPPKPLDGSPYGLEADARPLTMPSPISQSNIAANEETSFGERKKWFGFLRRGNGKGDEHKSEEDYPVAFNEAYEENEDGEPLWKKYIKEKDRETMRLPIFGWDWMPSLPLLGKKVDKIYHSRKELARLNLEIELDQQHPEKFPLMNSAFVQFNHQVAAHMACQSVSHHVPKQMTPRMVEISPDDVIWDNMSIKWWERYLRTFGVFVIVAAMVVGWAFPVAFTGLLSQLSYLEGNFTWLRWLAKLPEWFLSAIQGILPPLFLSILMALLPLILRFLTRNQGVHTGMAIELTVQNYYFAFLFVQIFLVVSISSGFSTIMNSLKDVMSVPELLAQNIPKAGNYFFSYMVLQAMSVSAGALVQIFNLIGWFILAPILDNTARMKWARTTNLNQMQWGTFFPIYTTLASIGLIYCVISPLIMVFNVLTFSLFWVVYRYNTLYVTKFRFDTGGLLFPKAINQLFTGIYVMEVCLIGMFFLVRDDNGEVACEGQAVCMIVVLILTILYQYLLNEAFNPLLRYLPITLEDEATRRDGEFERVQRRRLGLDDDEDDLDEDAEYEQQKETDREYIELTTVGSKKAIPSRSLVPDQLTRIIPGKNKSKRISWADRSQNRRSPFFGGRSDAVMPSMKKMREKFADETEAQAPQTSAINRALFSGIHDELEDLTPDERDQLVQRAFQHEALRLRRPVVWIPRDDIGVSDDEIFRTQRLSKHIWISNEYQALDGRCRAIFSRSPPDFSEVDLIQL